MHLKIAITLLLLKTINADIQAGNTCTLKSGEEGICKSIDQCDHGIKMVNTGIFPSLCGFNGTVAIICCRYTTVVSKQTREIPKKRGLGDITKKKCKEYANYTWEINDPVILLIDAPKINIFECHIQAISLVVGGTKADTREFPHMALIGYLGDNDIKWDCGGTIISENYILTAAHCAYHPRKRMKPSYVAVGFTKKQNFEGQLLKVLEGIQHPDFSYPILYNDIGLLKVEKMKFNSFVRPACLNVDSHVNREHAIATGWGKVGSSSLSDDLLKVKLQLFNTTLCNSILGEIGRQLKDGISSETQICAGSMTDIKDTCNGDSGGPLQIFHNESLDGTKCMYDIIGITSFGKRCGVNVGNPGVYTRVSAYIKWIEETVWPEN